MSVTRESFWAEVSLRHKQYLQTDLLNLSAAFDGKIQFQDVAILLKTSFGAKQRGESGNWSYITRTCCDVKDVYFSNNINYFIFPSELVPGIVADRDKGC